jgi:hypothetical protein
MTFGDLQSRVIATTNKRLGDSATLGGVAVSGIFHSTPAVTLGMMCENPVFVLFDADAAANYKGKALVVGGNHYVVSVAHKRDENGDRALQLDKA